MSGVRWRVHRVEPLQSPYDHELFCDIAGLDAIDEANGSYLAKLLAALAGIPLAIELVSRQASDGTPLTQIWRRWEEIGSTLARHPDFDPHRLTSLPRSIELSLESQRLSAAGYALFKLLGQLPAGLSPSDGTALLGDESFDAAFSLTRTGLGLRRGDRIDLLPPIRDHAARHHRPDDAVNARWTQHFANRAEALVDPAFSFDGQDARRRIVSEIPNINAAILLAIDHPELLPVAVAAARHYRRLLTHTGLGNTTTLNAIVDACRAAHDSIGEAQVCVQIGILAQERGDLDDAWQILERGLEANHRASNEQDVTNGKGDCLYRMADIHLHRSRLSDAKELYLRARGFYEITDNARGLGDAIYRLGDIEWRRANHAEARRFVDEAQPQFERAGFHLGVANCAWLRARVTLDAGDFDASERLHEIARQHFERTGVPLGLAHCRNGEGFIALGRGRYALARQCFDEAGQMYVDIKDERGIANCHLGLAKAFRAQGDLPSAREWANKALAVYTRTNVADCIARCYEELAGCCTDPSEAGGFALRARNAFLQADLAQEAHRMRVVFDLTC